MFAIIKPYLVGGIAVVIAALLASTMYFINATSDAKSETAVVNRDLSALQSKVDERNAEIKRDAANQQTVGVERAKSTQQFLDSKRTVEGHKGREAILRAKPTLTEKMINKSFANFADEISCATGDATPCK